MANLCIKTPSSASLVLIFQLLVLRPRPNAYIIFYICRPWLGRPNCLQHRWLWRVWLGDEQLQPLLDSWSFRSQCLDSWCGYLEPRWLYCCEGIVFHCFQNNFFVPQNDAWDMLFERINASGVTIKISYIMLILSWQFWMNLLLKLIMDNFFSMIRAHLFPDWPCYWLHQPPHCEQHHFQVRMT